MENNETPNFDLVILFSGGADSVLMLEMAKFMGYVPYCVLIDYQQLHIDELKSARLYLDKKGVLHQTVKIYHLQLQSGLTGEGQKGRFEGVHEMHVPSRNLMFVSVAASVAENMGIDTIWMGSNYDDYINAFPDCKQEWFGVVNDVLNINGPKPITLEAPLIGLTKESIVRVLGTLGVDEKDIYSGYGDL
jgi:7-cyano-7-deazaguanine synthase